MGHAHRQGSVCRGTLVIDLHDPGTHSLYGTPLLAKRRAIPIKFKAIWTTWSGNRYKNILQKKSNCPRETIVDCVLRTRSSAFRRDTAGILSRRAGDHTHRSVISNPRLRHSRTNALPGTASSSGVAPMATSPFAIMAATMDKCHPVSRCIAVNPVASS